MKNQNWHLLFSLALVALLIGACGSAPVSETFLPVTNEAAPGVTPPPTPSPMPTPVVMFAPSPTPGPSPTPAPLRQPLWTFETQGEVWSSPTVQDGVVYFGSDDHFLYAVDTATQQVIWKFETGDRVRSHPAVADGRIYFTSDDNNLYALDSQTGGEVWRFDLGAAVVPISRPNLSRNACDYAISSPVISEGVIYVGSANNRFYAVGASSGKVK